MKKSFGNKRKDNDKNDYSNDKPKMNLEEINKKNRKKNLKTHSHSKNNIDQHISAINDRQSIGKIGKRKSKKSCTIDRTEEDVSGSQDIQPLGFKEKKKKSLSKIGDNEVKEEISTKLSQPLVKKKKKKHILNHNDSETEKIISSARDTFLPEGKTKREHKKVLKHKHRKQGEYSLNSLEENSDESFDSSDMNGTVTKGKDESLENTPDDESLNSFDADSYPSDSDDEVVKPQIRRNFADASSEESSESSDNESQHTFDADSYPSDTEDEDEKKKGLPVNLVPSEELEERERRTIFVGNLPHSVERKELKKWFFKFGPVECVRLRSAPIADPSLPRKVAVIKKTFHESRSNIHAYIRFKTVEAAKNALSANGATFKEHVIRVDSSKHEGKYDSNKSVFVGNVPFGLEENALRDFFSNCGDIESVRIIRDKNTGVGKGFAYVNFRCTTAVPLALKLDGETLEKRELRVKPVKYQKKNAKPFLKIAAPKYNTKKFFNRKFNNSEKPKKMNTFQGEVSQKKIKKKSKKISAEERKRQRFSEILNNNKKTKTQ